MSLSDFFSRIALQADVLVAVSMLGGILAFFYTVLRHYSERRIYEENREKEARDNINISIALKKYDITRDCVIRIRYIYRSVDNMDDPQCHSTGNLFLSKLKSYSFDIREVLADLVAFYPDAEHTEEMVDMLKNYWDNKEHPYRKQAHLKWLCLKYENMIYLSMHDINPNNFLSEKTKEIRRRFLEENMLPRIKSVEEDMSKNP